jgi:predicted HAD superfamily hydrolase
MSTDEISATLWERDESLKEAGKILAERRPGIRVVSFDFFDTLVSRLCGEPNDLFIEAGRQLAARGLLVRPFTPMEFSSARIAADQRARKNAVRQGRSTEIKLNDIYAELKNVVTDVAAASEVEFEVERKYIFINPAMISLARHAGALGYKLAVISDTYFTVAQLKQLLRDNDCSPALFDAFFASCEQGTAKWNGQLYQELFRHFDLHPAELMHFGDNENADIEIARLFGVRAVHYYKTNPQLDQLLGGEKKLRSSDFHPAGALNSIRILTSRRADSAQDAFRDGAFVFGPALARYADWCVEKFKAADVRIVLALMREGELLGELVRRAAVAAGVDLKIVTCYTSRRATALASMSELTPADTLELLEGSCTMTLQSILDVLGLGEEIARQFDAKIIRQPLIMGDTVNGALKLLFDNPRVMQLLKAGRAESHALAFDYLKSLTGTESRVGILDIGWGASIQRNIARILRHGGQGVRTIGCYLACTRKSGRLALDGDEAHSFMEQEWNRSTILPELAVSSPVGSTNGYERDAAGAVRPVLGAIELSAAEQSVRRRLREGILEFQSFWLNLLARKGFSTETLADLDRQTASIFYRLLEFPSKPEAERLGSMTHDENYFGENLTAPLCDDVAARQSRRGGIQVVCQTSRCHWPQGVLAREHPRLVNALSLGWSDVASMGRLGAWHGTPIGDSGITDDEATALGVVAKGLAFQQVVLVGPLGPALTEIFTHLWRNENGAEKVPKIQPRLIVVGSASEHVASAEFISQCALVDGVLNDPETIRATRAALVPGVNAALVMSGELPEAIMSGLLNGLAPFLGREGAVLAACGRYAQQDIKDTWPGAKTVNAWIKGNGGELGFGLWSGRPKLRAQLSNWVIFQRASGKAVWNNQWMFTAADLALAGQTEDLLLTKS